MFTYKTKGTCSTEISFDVVDNKLHNVKFTRGCAGNLAAIALLVEGMEIPDVIKKLEGITCGSKPTSCSDQLVKAVQAYLAQ